MTIVSVLETVEKLDVGVIENAFNDVIHSYFLLLRDIAYVIFKYPKDVSVQKRKFSAIKKELLKYLVAHRKHYRLKSIKLLSDDNSVLFEINTSYSDNCEEFLKLEDILQYNEILNVNEVELNVHYDIHKVETKVIRTLKKTLGKSVITNEDVLQFVENHCLVDTNYFDNKCSSYEELQTKILNRREDFLDSNVSVEHINEMTFMFEGLIIDFEDEKSCAVCLDDYEKDQKVCRLPCNHFCCRSCTEKMFTIPEDDKTEAYYQCPICNDDCT